MRQLIPHFLSLSSGFIRESYVNERAMMKKQLFLREIYRQFIIIIKFWVIVLTVEIIFILILFKSKFK